MSLPVIDLSSKQNQKTCRLLIKELIGAMVSDPSDVQSYAVSLSRIHRSVANDEWLLLMGAWACAMYSEGECTEFVVHVLMESYIHAVLIKPETVVIPDILAKVLSVNNQQELITKLIDMGVNALEIAMSDQHYFAVGAPYYKMAYAYVNLHKSNMLKPHSAILMSLHTDINKLHHMTKGIRTLPTILLANILEHKSVSVT